MNGNTDTPIDEVRARLIEVAGRTTQDLGLGRILGQVIGFVYLQEEDCSLDELGDGLGLSKAAVSIAARQLEGLGLLQRVWKKGDRKSYYRTVDHFGKAVQHGILEMLRNKVRTVGEELDRVEEILSAADRDGESSDLKFIRKRMRRAQTLRKRARQILANPILKALGR